MNRLMIKPLFIIVLLLSGHSLQATEAGDIRPDDWPQYHRTSNAWRYSPLKQITKENVQHLKVAWIHQPGDITNGLQATPLAIDGIVYYNGPFNNTFALNGASGEMLWHYRPDVDPVAYELTLTGQNRGVTIGDGKLFLGTSDGKFIAIDQKSGKELWVKQIVDPRQCNCAFTSSPQLAGDILFGGTFGGDFASRGRIYAVHAESGEPAWSFDIIRDTPESWPAGAAEHGGGGAWLPGTYDEESDTIYIGTGNAAPDFDGATRPGDNKYTATLLALEPKTGKLKWHYQEIPHDIWDYDAAFELLRIKKAGKEFLIHPNKSGFVFVYDRQGGKPKHVWSMAENMSVATGYDLERGDLIGRKEHQRGVETIYCPGPFGIRNWNHSAYNPATGLWYNNTMDVCGRVKPVLVDPNSLGLTQPYFGSDIFENVPPPGGRVSARLEARDPLSGKLLWAADYSSAPGLGSLLTTGGNLVFNTDSIGVLRAHHAATGAELWHFNTGSGSRGGIISYAVNGRQYILATSGVSGWVYNSVGTLFPELDNRPGGGILIAFTLDE